MGVIFDVLFFLSMIFIALGIILLLIKALFKKGPSFKKASILVASSLTVFIISGIFMPELTPEQKAKVEERKEEKELAAAKLKSEKEEQEKQERQELEQKEKADQERKEEDKKKEKKIAEQENMKKEQQETKEEEEKLTTPKNAVKENIKNEKSKAKINLSNAKDAKSINELLKKDHDRIDNVLLENNIAIVIYAEGSFWSETSAFKDFAIDSTSIMRELKNNKNLKGIGFVQMMSMTDQKGNESIERTIITHFNKENYDEINFKNFVNQIYADSSNFYKVSNGYWMHPSIYQNIEEKTLNGLPFVPAESSKGFKMVSDITT
ncbi:hypothetical protein CAI16_03075 [Virgibacillus dokdonensis]|uniref:Uncharacterized protein n=1 Tax=Virgibacillus dokdonensis TaxID=302167 RepID=A0A3E0WXG3_9BACI|nr:hypothetical protein [Virgibacillus dokdonensis]RFA37069.1 hypothetical protein CAI16_03075 [Virgibacillus dokdonensis]